MDEQMDLGPLIEVQRYIGFGRPMVRGQGISTAAIFSRHLAGETVLDIADDYDMHKKEVIAAISFEWGRRWADGLRAKWNRRG